MAVHIGISGWTYKGWRGVFYPEDLPQKQELEFASRAFGSIEINGTHYALQRPSTFRSWHDRTPQDFIFSVKASRYITHMKQLKNVLVPLANFLGSGTLLLGKKLGPILWQLPPRFRFNPERIGEFLALLPQDAGAAEKLIHEHGEREDEIELSEADRKRRLRHCMEIRHPSFMNAEFFSMLRSHRVAFVFADTAGKWPYAEDLTSDFVYIRLHGAEQLYVSGYSEGALDWWASRIRKWIESSHAEDPILVTSEKPRRIREVFVYFDNDAKVRAPADAKRLREKLGLQR